MDLRDTAITWLANSGAAIPEIAAVSGHSPNTVHAILKHYLEANEAQADAAMDKLEAWMKAQGVKL
jgi:integrase